MSDDRFLEKINAQCVHIHEQNRAWFRDNFGKLFPLVIRDPDSDDERKIIRRALAMICYEHTHGYEVVKKDTAGGQQIPRT